MKSVFELDNYQENMYIIILSFNAMNQGPVTSDNITIQAHDIKTFFNSIILDDDNMINEVVEKVVDLGGFVVHFGSGEVIIFQVVSFE